MYPSPNIAPQTAGPGHYSALQLAAAVGVSKRHVLRELSGIEPAGTLLVHGNETPAWTFDVLPETMRQQISAAASEQRLSLADYLDSICKPWQPKIPLADVTDACTAQARKLRTALLPALQRINSPILSPADHVRLGLADYQRATGEQITERHWRRLIATVTRRAGTDENYTRLELYLPENPPRKPANTTGKAFDLSPLAELLKCFTDPEKPTENEKAALWAQAFEILADGAQTNRDRKQLRRAIAGELQRIAPWLASNERSLRVTFDRKFARWQESEGKISVLVDGRTLKLGVARSENFDAGDIDLMVWHICDKCGFRIAQGVREFREQGGHSNLTQAMQDYLATGAASKSHVPRRLYDVLKLKVEAVKPFFFGKKAKDDATASITRDYSKLTSMQIVSADDVTWPVWFYIPDGQGWYTLTRGQCLIMADVKSRRVLGWSLQQESNYTGLTIRTLMNRVCSDPDLGLPKKFEFERGIWERSKIVTGRPPTGWQIAGSPLDFQTSWEQLGVGIMHRKTARGKTVEGIIGALQNLMERVRGYGGREERHDLREVTKLAQADVRGRRVDHPGELFLSFEEWNTELGRLIELYNATSQDGNLAGLSPDEAFEAFWPKDNPPMQVDDNCRHLLAHYVMQVPVGINGITFRIGKKKYTYRNERTGEDRGKNVLAWFDPECPEILCVTDLNKKNPYHVMRETQPAYDAAASDPLLAKACAEVNAHNQPAKTLYRTLAAKFARPRRRNFVDTETADLGRQIADGRKHMEAGQRQQASRDTKARKAYNTLGMAAPAASRNRPEVAEAATRLAELLNEPDTE